MSSPLIMLSPGRLKGSRSDLPLPGSHLMSQQSGTEREGNVIMMILSTHLIIDSKANTCDISVPSGHK